jgi:hypothetical protein
MGGTRDDDGRFEQKEHARQSSVGRGATVGDLASQLAGDSTVGKHTLTEGIAPRSSGADAIAFFDHAAGEARAQMAALARALAWRDRLLAVTSADRLRICLTTARRHLEHIPAAALVERRPLLAELERRGQATIGDARMAGILEAAPPLAFGDSPRIAPLGIQRKAAGAPVTPDAPIDVAARGVAGATTPLPYQDAIQASFGRHDVSQVRAATGGAAAESAAELGASAFAVGDRVGLRAPPPARW